MSEQQGIGVSSDSMIASSRNAYAVTPSDSEILPVLPKGLYVGTGGNLVLRTIDSAADVTFQNVPDGAILDVRASYVRQTGTTASGIVALA